MKTKIAKILAVLTVCLSSALACTVDVSSLLKVDNSTVILHKERLND